MFLLIIFVVLGPAPSAASGTGQSLVDEGSTWERSAWRDHGSIDTDKNVHRGDGSSVRIQATRANDIRYRTPVTARAGRFYRFSAWIRTSDVTGRAGANLAVEGTFNRSRADLRGSNDWTRVEQVFRAGEDGQLFFSLRLGHWHAPATGTAWFDDVRLEELHQWNGAYERIIRAEPNPGVVTKPIRLATLVLFVPFFVGGLIWVRRSPAAATLQPSRLSTRSAFGLGLLLVTGVLVRLLLAMASAPQGAPPPLETWALFLAGASDPGQALRPAELVPPPPVWTYWLALIGSLAKAGLWEHTLGFRLLLRAPAIVAEMTALAFVLVYLKPRVAARFWPAFALLLVLGPALPYASALLGLPETLGGAALVLAITQLRRQRHLVAGTLLGFSVAAAPSLAWLAVPVLAWLWSIRGPRAALGTFAIAAACVWLAIAPVAELYAPWPIPPALLTGPVEGSLWSGVKFAPALLALVPGAIVLGITRLASGARARRITGSVTPVPLTWLAALTLMATWSGPDPALLYAAVFLGMLDPEQGQDRRQRWLWFALAVMASAYWGFVYYLQYLDLSPSEPGAAVVLIQCAILGAGLAAWHLALRDRNPPREGSTIAADVPSTGTPLQLPEQPRSPFQVNGRDWVALAMVAATGFYLISHDMGEHRHPLNPYQVGKADETYFVTFERPERISRVRLYTGANGFGKARFEVEQPGGRAALWQRDNGAIYYTGEQRPRRSTFKVLERKTALDEPLSTLRITLEGEAFDIIEIVFYDHASRILTPASVEKEGGFPVPAREHPLFDEPGRVTADSSYRAETYWDEVYYARTAYELARGQAPYERTHPPLGKILIALGVRGLDMTPFGWRFANALVIASLPLLLWAAARWLYGTRIAAYAAAFLAVFELMFFVHGRWANIDAFLTFFLFCFLVALLRWYQLGSGDFNRRNAGWFVGAGLCFGLALATKWSALFTGFAVFLLWLVHQFSRAIALGSDTAARRHYYRVRLPMDLLAWGTGFVLFPFIVYYVSYAPVLSTLPGSPAPFSAAGWQAFLDLQAFQWSYHADREVGHKSSSLFLTWPVMWQPVSLLKIASVPEGMRATLQIMGNPVIWWTGFAAMLALGWRATLGRDRTAIFLSGIYFLQCLPWLLVTRTTYLYHYLPCLPILILGIVYWGHRMDFRHRTPRVVAGLFALAVLTGFALYYPYVTATPVPVDWTDRLRVFETWARL